VGCSSVNITKAATSVDYQQIINFPADEGKHNNEWVEWWYYAGHLQDEQGRNYSFELVFFKVNQTLELPRNFSVEMVYFAHFAVSDEAKKEHREAEREFFPLWGQVKIEEGHLNLQYSDWGASSKSPFCYHIWARNDKMAIDLHLKSTCAPILGAVEGTIEMGEKGVSHYYSIPRLVTEGILTLKGKDYLVSGTSWMDHQWGSWVWGQPYGWDWWGLNLDNGLDMIIYSFRNKDYTSQGTTAIVRYPDGSQFTTNRVILKKLKWWSSPDTGIRYPLEWSLEVLDLEATFVLSPTFPSQEMTTKIKYWEGGCLVEGEIRGQRLKGKGYMELVGYQWSDFSFLKWGSQTIISGLFNIFP
jgi:predicted secreted hydrolase